jgi:hypothetical protein
MKRLWAILLLCGGCVMSYPSARETTTLTNGTVIVREIKLTTWAGWPASQNIEKQHASIGKTVSVGSTGLEQESGGTNVVDALKYINDILGKIR